MQADDVSYIDPNYINGLNLYCYCYNNPVMYEDPEGNSAFVGLLISSMIVSAIIGGAASGYKAYSLGERNWDLCWDIVGGAIFGAAIGATIALGGAAGLAATGASISGFGLSFLPSLFISAGAVSTANMAKYSLDYAATDWSGWSIGGLLLSSVQGAIKGASTFAIAFLGGKYGLFDKFANKANNLIFPGVGNIYMPRSLFCWSRMFLGEGGATALFVSAPDFGVRWLIDVINESV